MNIIMYASRPQESYNFKYAIIYRELKLFLVSLYNNNKDEHGNLVMWHQQGFLKKQFRVAL